MLTVSSENKAVGKITCLSGYRHQSSVSVPGYIASDKLGLGAIGSVHQSGWTYSPRPEASAGTVYGGFGCAGADIAGIRRELPVGIASRQ
ncbi:hypothetical protein ACWD25_40440 [Streptomyces sp. NPDC002920]